MGKQNVIKDEQGVDGAIGERISAESITSPIQNCNDTEKKMLQRCSYNGEKRFGTENFVSFRFMSKHRLSTVLASYAILDVKHLLTGVI